MEFSQGFTLTITEADGKSHEVKTERVQTIARSNILSMPSVTVDGIPSDEAVPQESIVIELAEGATRDNLSFTISTDDESYGYYCTLMSTGAEQWLNKTSFEGLAESLSKDMSGTGFYNFQGTASTHFTHRHSGDKPDYQSAFIVMTLDQNGNASEAGYLIESFDP